MSFDYITAIILGLWFLSAVFDYSDFCYLWQLKEYRVDRIRDFFSTRQGQRYWLRYPLLWRSLIVIGLLFWPLNQVIALEYIIFFVFIFDVGCSFYRYYRKRSTRPKITAKTILIVALSIGVEGVLIVVNHDWPDLLFLLLIRFFTISGVIVIINHITNYVKSRYIHLATKKMSACQDLIVIGITGSYGKTTVKEYVSHVLSQKFRVSKTPRHVNTDIGVAQFILKTDFKGIDIFVVEMGAYRIGEIKKICDMVKPRVGILTAIIEQHLSLFGSIQNIQQAKYELLRSIPPNGYIATNADNFYCVEKIGELPCKNVETFSLDPDKPAAYFIDDITSSSQGIICNITYRSLKAEISSPVLGGHQAVNIAPAIMVATYFGLTNEQIERGVKTLPQVEAGIRSYQYGSCSVIDDSYNSNPQGFKAALDILGTFSSRQKRIVITRGMLELGVSSDELHEEMGEEISFYADELIIITPDFVEPLERGADRVKDKYHLRVMTCFDPEKLLNYVRAHKHKEAVILLENRIPKIVRQEIMSIV